MIRKIIKIDEDKCVGCGLCANACHEGAIKMSDGKAKLIRDDYCDGLGNCLPVCPTGAISFEEREAAAFDEKAVKESQAPQCTGCKGSSAKEIKHTENDEVVKSSVSRLSQWPVQIKLVPVNAPYFNNANLLISADCAAYAYGNFHEKFIKSKVTLIGCPKLDEGDYSEKLLEIIKNNNIKSITLVRMEVPCCKGLENALKTALLKSGKLIPWQIVIISAEGEIIE